MLLGVLMQEPILYLEPEFHRFEKQSPRIKKEGPYM
jgi:hypothetical protein